MKVEKCPRCGKEPFLSNRWNIRPWVYFCSNQKCSYEIGYHAHTKTGAIIKWNIGARREAKRIAKEGKGNERNGGLQEMRVNTAEIDSPTGR